MDTTVKPPASFFKIDVDDVQVNCVSMDWRTDRMFEASAMLPGGPPVDVDIKTLSTHPLFRTALLELIFPFDQEGCEFSISATYSYTSPDLTIFVQFQGTMDQTVTPLTTDFVIYSNDVPKTPDSIVWANPTLLEISYSEIGLITDYDIALLTSTDLLRCSNEVVIPPFRLNTLLQV